MSEADDQREWLRSELALLGRGAKSALARHLRLAPDAITRMLNVDPEKEPRRIQADELARMKDFFDLERAKRGILSRITPALDPKDAAERYAQLPPDLQRVFEAQLSALELVASERQPQSPQAKAEKE
jgi:hypothetical protein